MKLINIELSDMWLPYLLRGLMSHARTSYIGGCSFGKIYVVSNHSMDHQVWTLDDKEISPEEIPSEHLIELYYCMESHRINNLKKAIH